MSGVAAAVCVPYERARVEAAMPKVRKLVPDARIVTRSGAQWIVGTVPRGTTHGELAGMLALAQISALRVIVGGAG